MAVGFTPKCEFKCTGRSGGSSVAGGCARCWPSSGDGISAPRSHSRCSCLRKEGRHATGAAPVGSPVTDARRPQLACARCARRCLAPGEQRSTNDDPRSHGIILHNAHSMSEGNLSQDIWHTKNELYMTAAGVDGDGGGCRSMSAVRPAPKLAARLLAHSHCTAQKRMQRQPASRTAQAGVW